MSRQTLYRGLKRSPRAGFRSGGGGALVPPNFGWTDFWWAEDLAIGEIDAAITPRYGSGALTPSATGPTVATGGADFNAKKYVTHVTTAEHLYKAQAAVAQPFVIVAYAKIGSATTASTASIFDSYTDGTAPAANNRCMAQYINTTVDQRRMNGGTQIQANWGGGFEDVLWEIKFNGASSAWLREGVSVLSGDAGAYTMAGFTIGGRFDLAAAGNIDDMQWAYVGRISVADWATLRPTFLAWHNLFYAQAAV